MLIDFTEYELETIANAMEDYINYDDELLYEDELIGGLSVANRVESIQDKIYKVLVKSIFNNQTYIYDDKLYIRKSNGFCTAHKCECQTLIGWQKDVADKFEVQRTLQHYKKKST